MFTALQSGEKGYLKLFEALEKHQDYDEEKLRKLFAGEDFIKRLPAVKNYLSGQLLKSLRVVRAGNTRSSEIKGLLEDIAILHEKRLYKQALKIIEKTRELAHQQELFESLLELNRLEEQVLLETLDLERFEANLPVSYALDKELLDLLHNVAEYRNLYNRIVLLNKKIKEARTEAELRLFTEISNHPLLQSVDRARCFDSRNYYYRILLIYNHAKGDNKTSLELAKAQLALIESFPDKITEDPKSYLSALNNILLGQIHLHAYENFGETLAKLKAFPHKSISQEVSHFIHVCTFEMVMYLDTGDFEKSVDIRAGLISGMKKYEDKINPIEKITLLYNLFYSYFGTGEFSKALEIINQLQNRYQKELRYDIQCAVKILNLILHYELGSNLLLEHNAISTYRFLIKSKRLYKLENIVLDFIRKKMPSIYSPKDEIAAFKQLRTEFMELTPHPYESKAFEYFDYISWLDSKIEGKPFAEIVRRKFKANYGG